MRRLFHNISRPLLVSFLSASYVCSSSHLEPSEKNRKPLKKNEKLDLSVRSDDNVAIIAGTASKELSQRVCDEMGKQLSPTEVSKFSDGETSISLRDSMRGKDVFIIQTCSSPVNESTMELLLSIGAARRSGASSVTAVIPYFGYRLNRRGFPMSSTHHSRFLWNAANDIAKMLLILGADKVISFDLQRPGQNHEACFFKNSLPAETVSTNDLFIQHFSNNLPQNTSVIIVAPTTELVKKAKKYQMRLRSSRSDLHVDCGAFLRTDADSIPLNGAGIEMKGDVKDKVVILIADYIGKFLVYL
jgi:ribose-phosphate pyrophosphokinase